VQERFQDHADAFAPSNLAPACELYMGWQAGLGEDRPL